MSCAGGLEAGKELSAPRPAVSFAAMRWRGLGAGAALFAVWVVVHVYSVFAFQLRGWALLWAPALIALQCWLLVGLFIVAHDAMHQTLAPGWPRVNAAVGGFLTFLYAGFSYKVLRRAHMDHHRYPGTERDPDFSTLHSRAFWPWYGAFMRHYFGWPSAVFVLTVNGVYWLLGAPPLNILVLYGVPALLSSLQLFYFGTYRPHHVGAAFDDQHNARTDHFPTWLSLLTCFHFGYHHTHHLHPEVPWWQLPKQYRQADL